MMNASNAPHLRGFCPPWQQAGVNRESPVLLGLSGGADSRVLLHLLASASLRDGFPLLLAHVNHGIRGEEAIRDREFCKALAAEYGLELVILNADVPALAKENRRSLEEEARAVRYDFFARVMEERNIPLLATAHHADDQLETVLFRLCRGSGLQGLCGIAPVREFAKGYLTRPLLGCTRKEILEYCQQQKLGYVVDSTNADTAYARNCIRTQVIPVLESLFADPQLRVGEMTASLREDEAYLVSLAEEFLTAKEEPWGILIASLMELPLPVRSRVLQRWILKKTGCIPQRVHLLAMEELAGDESGKPATEVALPLDHIGVAELGYLRILPRKESLLEPYHIPFSEGEQAIPAGEFRVSVKNQIPFTKIHNLYTQTCININTFFDIIKKDAYWRPRREGDTLLRGGMHKKVRRLMNEKNIPLRLRDTLPLLCDGEGVLYLPFVGWRDGVISQKNKDLDKDTYVVTVEIL